MMDMGLSHTGSPGISIIPCTARKSVVEAMLRHKFGTYWNQTETYEALKIYIQMNMDGLQDSSRQNACRRGSVRQYWYIQ